MRDQLEQRLETLKSEFSRGEERLAQLESDGAKLRQTLLRISGAIQVLEELLQAEGETAAAAPGRDTGSQP